MLVLTLYYDDKNDTCKTSIPPQFVNGLLVYLYFYFSNRLVNFGIMPKNGW